MFSFSHINKLLEESFTVIFWGNKVIETYCNLYQKLKEEGTTIPDAEPIMAAITISKNMNIKTRDKHFERLRELGLKLA